MDVDLAARTKVRRDREPEPQELVWYVAYGSNVVPERLACYLQGGRPEGSRRTYIGSRDRSPPLRSQPVTIAHRLFFAGVSTVWDGGGVAFVDPVPSPGLETSAAAYLITIGQLSDLVVQECGGEAPGPAISVLPEAGEQLHLDTGRYDLLVGVAPIEGLPAALITSRNPPAPNDPSQSYARMMRRGRP